MDVWPERLFAVLTQRRELLGRLGDEPQEKSDLEADLPVSRSTIDRGIRELLSEGLIERTDEGYRPTVFGTLAHVEFQRLGRRLAVMEDARPLLDVLPPETAHNLDAVIFDGAELVIAERSTPNRPVDRMMDLVENARAVRALGAAVVRRYVDVYRRKIVEEGMVAEVVLQPEVLEELVSQHTEALTEMLETGNAMPRRTDRRLPFGMVLADGAEGTELGIVVYSDDGIKGFVGNDNTAAVQWGERFFRCWWAEAEPLSWSVDDDAE